MNIEKVFQIIEDNIEDADFVGEIGENQIEKAEQITSVRFPTSYKKFLRKYGAGDIFGIEIYGIIADPDTDGQAIPNVVWLHQQLVSEGMSKAFIPVSDSGDGCYYVLDTSQMNDKEECPVLLLNPGNLQSEKAYEDFADFLGTMIG